MRSKLLISIVLMMTSIGFLTGSEGGYDFEDPNKLTVPDQANLELVEETMLFFIEQACNTDKTFSQERRQECIKNAIRMIKLSIENIEKQGQE